MPQISLFPVAYSQFQETINSRFFHAPDDLGGSADYIDKACSSVTRQFILGTLVDQNQMKQTAFFVSNEGSLVIQVLSLLQTLPSETFYSFNYKINLLQSFKKEHIPGFPTASRRETRLPKYFRKVLKGCANNHNW